MMETQWSVLLILLIFAHFFDYADAETKGNSVKGKSRCRRKEALLKKNERKSSDIWKFSHQASSVCGLPNEQKCKRHRNIVLSDGRIANGYQASPHQFPWMMYIKLYVYDYFYSSCDGSLLSPNWVLTATHCVFGNITKAIVFANVYNVHDLEKSNSSSVLSRTVAKDFFWIHEGYNPKTFERDITLLYLLDNMPLSRTVRPICLPKANVIYLGEKVTIVGWGRVADDKSNSSSYATFLQYADNRPIVNMKVCRRYFAIPPPADHFCIDTDYGSDPDNPNGGISTCPGDSGGPIMYREGDNYVQVGIVSYGGVTCTTRTPTLSTRVADYREWIYYITGI